MKPPEIPVFTVKTGLLAGLFALIVLVFISWSFLYRPEPAPTRPPVTIRSDKHRSGAERDTFPSIEERVLQKKRGSVVRQPKLVVSMSSAQASVDRKRDLSTLKVVGFPRIRSSFSPKNREDAVTRGEYESRRLRDPATGRIPPWIREKELAMVAALPRRDEAASKKTIYREPWKPRGPYNVGGRTRALAIDAGFNGTTNRRILAGGISGGLFVSVDDGASWRLATSLNDHASVTCIAQDPNHRNVWYYGTGENMGNSASARGAFYAGQGLFKSTDNGNTWVHLPSTSGLGNPNQLDYVFDIVYNVVVSPATSDVIAAIYGGIVRSRDGGQTWYSVLAGRTNPLNPVTDIAVARDGTLFATLSRHGLNVQEYGIYRSDDNGDTWIQINPYDLVDDPYRMVLATAPSDPETAYVVVQATAAGADAGEHQLFRYQRVDSTWSAEDSTWVVTDSMWTNLSGRLPDFDDFIPSADVGEFSSQGGYDLIVIVKPDDPDVIWVGGTNLMRSGDGGRTYDWVGGYHPVEYYYPDHHPDQHSMSFYPNDPDRLISGHDGGLSRTDDAMDEPQTWETLNNGYLTSQVYAVAIDPEAGGELVMGGMQDNGTWATDEKEPDEPWTRVLTGDGGFAALTPGGDPFYVSAQLGQIYRADIRGDELVGTYVSPEGPTEEDYLFITPYALDPNDSRVMYLAAGNAIWRNSNLDDIPIENLEPTSINWKRLSGSAVSGGMTITALGVTTTPADRLYYGATDYQGTTRIVRVEGASTDPRGVNITPPGITGGSYPSSISVNPLNGDELLLVCSNYNVPGIWYSNSGGATWENVEGNLGGVNGPSIRWASIVPTGQSTVYFVATSTGIYSTEELAGTRTSWVQEAYDLIGNVVVDMMAVRPEDGLIVAGTHGRGIYDARLEPAELRAVAMVDTRSLDWLTLYGETTEEIFVVTNGGKAPLEYHLDKTSGFENAAYVTLNQAGRTLDPGESDTVRVIFDAKGQDPGIYTGAIQLTGNGGEIQISIQVTVTGVPSVMVDQSSFTWRVSRGETKTEWFGISNTGTAPLTYEMTVSDGTPEKNRFTISPLSGRVEPGSADSIQASFNAENLTTGSYAGYVNITTNAGTKGIRAIFSVIPAVGTETNELPDVVALNQNYPNPFNPETVIGFSIPYDASVKLVVYDLNGREVITLVNGFMAAGKHMVTWNAGPSEEKPVASGTYLYQLEVTGNAGQPLTRMSKTMVLLK